MSGEPIDPTDVLNHSEDYLLDGDPIDSVCVRAFSAKGAVYSDAALAWFARITRKPRMRKVKARAFASKVDGIVHITTQDELAGDPNYLKTGGGWIGPIFEIEVSE